jgi:hypothetical protein
MLQRYLPIIAALGVFAFAAAQTVSAAETRCTTDCSKEAGYAWAKRMNIVDPAQCGGDTSAFIDGCREYAASQEKGLEGDLNNDGGSTSGGNGGVGFVPDPTIGPPQP